MMTNDTDPLGAGSAPDSTALTILVTRGTGELGRPTVALLREAGRDVRVLSRRPGSGRVVGDLTSGAGLDAALDGVDVVLHLATSAGAKDPKHAANIVEAGRAAGISHIVFISIVGVDEIPYSYYRAKLASEQIVAESGLGFTILRATQFHAFIRLFLHLQRRLPVIVGLDLPDQPIAVEEVAGRLVELVGAGPSGRMPDIGGPEQLRLTDAIALWQHEAGTRKPVLRLPLFGRTIRAFREGRHLTSLPRYGSETFAQYAAREAPRGLGSR